MVGGWGEGWRLPAPPAPTSSVYSPENNFSNLRNTGVRQEK